MYRTGLIAVTVIFLMVMFGCSSNIKEDTSASEDIVETDKTSVSEDEGDHPASGNSVLVDEPRLFSSGGRFYAASTSTYTFEIEDTFSGINEHKVAVDDGEYETYKKPITFDSEGPHTIRCWASDNVGNKTTPLSFSIIIDNTAPDTAYTLRPKAVKVKKMLYVPTDCKLTFQPKDKLSGVQKTMFSLDGAKYQIYTNAIDMPSPGKHRFDFASQDNVGTWEKENNLTVIVDGNPPIVTFSPNDTLYAEKSEIWSPSSGSYYESTAKPLEEVDKKYVRISCKYSVKAIDDASGVKALEVSIDGSGFREYIEPISFKSEGRHTILCKASDEVANKSEVLDFSIIVDDSAPRTDYKFTPRATVLNSEMYTNPATELSFTANDRFSVVTKIMYSIDDGGFQKYSKPIKIPGDGIHTIVFKSCDSVGIWEEEQVFYVVVDGTPPVSDIIASGQIFDKNGKKTAPSGYKYFLSSNDNYSGVADIKYSVDGGSFITYSRAFSLSPGEHIVEYFATDRTGNKEAKKKFKINVEKTITDILIAK